MKNEICNTLSHQRCSKECGNYCAKNGHVILSWNLTLAINNLHLVNRAKYNKELPSLENIELTFPNKPWGFLTCLYNKYFENAVGKCEIAHNEQFHIFFAQCFLPFQRTVCRFHWIQNCRLQTLSVWKSLKFAVWKRVKKECFLESGLKRFSINEIKRYNRDTGLQTYVSRYLS